MPMNDLFEVKDVDRKFYAERVLNEQPFVKDDKQTVGKYAEAGGVKVKNFEYWQLGS